MLTQEGASQKKLGSWAARCWHAADQMCRTHRLTCCRYVRDLPAGVIRMNDECLKLRDHTAGYQTVEDIQAVVGEAIGLHPKPLADDDYIDEAMARPPPVSASECLTGLSQSSCSKTNTALNEPVRLDCCWV